VRLSQPSISNQRDKNANDQPLQRSSDLVRFQAGEAIFAEGEPAEPVYVLAERLRQIRA
jgi:CRP-like cAMP-binding protein